MGEFRLVHYHAIIYFVVCANSSVTGADSCKDESVSSVGQKWSEQPKFSCLQGYVTGMCNPKKDQKQQHVSGPLAS